MSKTYTYSEEVGFIKICVKALALLSLSVSDEASTLDDNIGEAFQANEGKNIATITKWNDGSATFVALVDDWTLKGTISKAES